MTDSVRFKDFSKKREPIVFTIDGDEFSAFPMIPVPVLQEVVQIQRGKGDADKLDVVERGLRVLDLLLDGPSAERLRARMASRDLAEAVDFDQVSQIISWLMEVHTGRPTRPSSESSEPSPTGEPGQGSTPGAGDTESGTA